MIFLKLLIQFVRLLFKMIELIYTHTSRMNVSEPLHLHQHCIISLFKIFANFYCRNYPVRQPSIPKQAFTSNSFFRILESNLNSLTSMYPVNEVSEDPIKQWMKNHKIIKHGFAFFQFCVRKRVLLFENSLTMCPAVLFSSFSSIQALLPPVTSSF